MIYEPIITDEGFKRFDNIPSDYYCCRWDVGTNQIDLMTLEGYPLTPPTYPNAPMSKDGFAILASEGYQAFLDEIENRGLILPIEQ